jgi:2-keto-3-deoxy-L-rhamnonate aldolase RhmA
MRNGDLALGLIVRLGRSADVAAVAAATDHDFIFIDYQHGLFSVETIGNIALAAIGMGVAPIVRVRGVGDPDVLRLLDNGVMGIVFPDVNTRAEAEQAVAACKFAPEGARSVSGSYPVFQYRPRPLAESIRILNDTTLVICMVETREGLANVEEIAAVPGVDVVHIGCNDLLAEMGKPGKFDDPEIAEAVQRVIAAAKANGRWAGLGGDKDIGRQTKLVADGIQFITTQSDVAFMTAEANRRVGELRKATPPGRE